jgi:predicted enzyme involved in methoxymalonyl-ACP biosynthesis
VVRVAEELNLGLDSFLFIDDNPAEREMVRKLYPMVPALDPGTEESWRLLERLFQMSNTRDTDARPEAPNWFVVTEP